MAEEKDEKELNADKMAAEAVVKLGGALTEFMSYLTLEQQREVLIKLTCFLACMCTAQRLVHMGERRHDFIEQARRFLISLTSHIAPPPRGEDYKVSFGDGVEVALASDPGKAEAVKSIIADIRQALDGVATGKFANPEEALASLGGTFVSLDDLPEEIQAKIIGDDDKGTLQ